MLDREVLILAVHENIEHLGVEALDVVNLRVGPADVPADGPISEPFSALAELKQQGLIRHLGISGATGAQLTEAQTIAPVVTVQNLYNVAQRADDALVERCAQENIAFAPFFPLGGFTPLQSEELSAVARELEASAQQVALAWLLQRSPTIVLIPGTSSVEHLRENVAAGSLRLPDETVERLDKIGA
ncbi:MAG: pyridoxine 4-dehydrogenase [Solirubrobacterales bacterium]|nr:pyridoxine 4-dehydrogenase [Solirubrobacterales bacterium]